MAWSATVRTIRDNTVPNGVKYAIVEFTSPGKSFRREFKFPVGADLSPGAVTAFLIAECAKLDTVDSYAAEAQALVDSEITAAGVSGTIEIWRLKAALEVNGQIATVNTAIATSNIQRKAMWSNGDRIRRDSQMINALRVLLGMSEAQMDALFAQAAAIGV